MENVKEISTGLDKVDAGSAVNSLRASLNTVLRGKEDKVEILITALFAGGAVLLEDVPGVGKTTLAAGLAACLDCSFARIQFTPDLLPGDITGSSIYNPVTGSFDFRPGPVFCNILLADEINRASPRTQSALLEAMNETQVTVENKTYPLPDPFMVIATQNPIDFHGTYPLPESQLDRFLLCMDIGYPDADTESQIITSRADVSPVEKLSAVMSAEQVCSIRHAVSRVRIESCVAGYIMELVTATRDHPLIKFGVSTRGSLMLAAAAKSCAFIDGRDYVSPDDVQRYAGLVMAHRIVSGEENLYTGLCAKEIVEEIVSRIKVPV